ncbi:hypothetical protein H4217_006903 [Coemansia sp. RSA 1939]|nr:hypothetical protein H4217_006903 [Coemansia sp. RSA 1939]KAJ2617406.1 hypothetical protein EV177_000563 [Coemansia sp. RSA 1804]KAJ2667561.1 hypothetical protein GGH99_006644 [Coemansia sp. RSA 1285]
MRELTAEERAWAARQVALVVGATEDDALPLADFLLGVEDPTELQTQLLDMLGESPLALDFSSELIAKRFPPAAAAPRASGVNENSSRRAEGSRPQSSESRPHKRSQHIGDADSGSNMVAYRKPGPDDIAYFPGVGKSSSNRTSNNNAGRTEPAQQESGRASGEDTTTPAAAAADGKPTEQKSVRQLKKDRQQLLRQQKEEERRRHERATRKRVRCECQASEHPLLTNCLTCGRIVCQAEGPGPCMFCGTEVESPDQQLQLHMRRILRQSAERSGDDRPPGKGNGSSGRVIGGGGMLYSRKAGGGLNPQDAGALLRDSPTPHDSSATASCHGGDRPDAESASISRGEELSEEEYLQLAFRALGIDGATADPAAVREAETWVRATRRKERLLDYDRTAAQRTRLIDQLSDFDPFAVGKWMSPEEKIEAERMKAQRVKEDEEREARLRRGMRVLRLDFSKGAVDLKRADADADAEDDGDGDHSSPAGGLASGGAAKQKPSSLRTGTPNGSGRAPVTAATTQAQKTAAKPSAADGSFANNPHLGDRTAPKFVLSPEKTNAQQQQQPQQQSGKKAKTKDKGNGKNAKSKEKETRNGKGKSAVVVGCDSESKMSVAASGNDDTNESHRDPPELEEKARDMARRRQMLRVQTNTDEDSILF